MRLTERDIRAALDGRLLYYGPFGSMFRMPPFNPDADVVKPLLRPMSIEPPIVRLSEPVERQLRVGLGPTDMEIRWLAWLDERDTLRLWRSWTGFEIYRAQIGRRPDGLAVVSLEVETDPDRYRPELPAEPDRFASMLGHVLELLGVRLGRVFLGSARPLE